MIGFSFTIIKSVSQSIRAWLPLGTEGARRQVLKKISLMRWSPIPSGIRGIPSLYNSVGFLVCPIVRSSDKEEL